MERRLARSLTRWTAIVAAACGVATTVPAERGAAQPRPRRVCTASSEVVCGQHDVGPGIAAPRLGDNGADVGVIWTTGSAETHAIQFARIDERARIFETFVPIAHGTGDLAIAGAVDGFLVAYGGDGGTFVVRVDRSGQVLDEPRRVGDAADTLDLVRLTAVGGGTGLLALVLSTGINVRVVYFEPSGTLLDAPPQGVVFYGVGRLTRVFIVPFASHVTNGRPVTGYHTEAQTADTVVATVSSTIASYTNLRRGQPFGGSSNRIGRLELNLGTGGADHLTMITEDGAYRDVFAPANEAVFENTGVVGGRRPRGRGLAGEANVRDRCYLATSPDSGVEVGLIGAQDEAATLVIARVHVRSSAAPRTSAGRPRR